MIRIGVICPSEIAFRRFMPALQQARNFEYIGVAAALYCEWTESGQASLNKSTIPSEYEKACHFAQTYGGKVFEGYENMVSSNEIDAVYLPLPPALHFKWAEKALRNGKHVLVEKPSSTSLSDTTKLVTLAKNNSLAIHENYMFVYHNQLKAINAIINSGELGEVRIYRINFGFPKRDLRDFRYNKLLGGGALLDAGGYTLKYASLLLGNNSFLTAATANYITGYEVDMYGSATMQNPQGEVAQISFGMDNDYRCELEIWCSKATLTTNRILTAPAGFVPTYTIKKNQEIETHTLPADDAFLKSILQFEQCINNSVTRDEEYKLIEHQSALVEKFKELCRMV